MRDSKSTVFSVFLKPILFGISSGSVFCILLLLLFAIAATITDIPNALVVPLAIVAVSIASFFGAFIAAKLTKRNGWLIGLLNSVALFVLSIISGWRFFETADTDFIMIKLLIMTASGMLGGIVSVNSGKRRT